MSDGRRSHPTASATRGLRTACETRHAEVFCFAAGAAGVRTTSKKNTQQWPPMRAMRLSLMWINDFRRTPDLKWTERKEQTFNRGLTLNPQ